MHPSQPHYTNDLVTVYVSTRVCQGIDRTVQSATITDRSYIPPDLHDDLVTVYVSTSVCQGIDRTVQSATITHRSYIPPDLHDDLVCQGSCPSLSGHPHLHPAIPIFVQPDHPHRLVHPAGPTRPYWPLSYSLPGLSYVL